MSHRFQLRCSLSFPRRARTHNMLSPSSSGLHLRGSCASGVVPSSTGTTLFYCGHSRRACQFCQIEGRRRAEAEDKDGGTDQEASPAAANQGALGQLRRGSSDLLAPVTSKELNLSLLFLLCNVYLWTVHVFILLAFHRRPIALLHTHITDFSYIHFFRFPLTIHTPLVEWSQYFSSRLPPAYAHH